MKIVLGYAVACAIAAIVPGAFPVSIILGLILTYHLSVAHGVPFRRGEQAIIWALLLFASLLLSLGIEALSARFPGSGWAIKGGIVLGFVIGVGRLVDAYFAAE